MPKHARVSVCPVVAGEFLRAAPGSSKSGASPEDVLLLNKRQNHIAHVVPWIVINPLLLQPCCYTYCNEVRSTERSSQAYFINSAVIGFMAVFYFLIEETCT